MARIAGVDIPREKRVEIALTYIFGIGLPTSQKILAATAVSPDTRVKDLTDEETQKIRREIEDRYKVEGDLRREVSMSIKRLMDIGCYRGQRHKLGLPVRDKRRRRTPAPEKGPAAQWQARRWLRSSLH